ncbi:Peptide deformylase [Granulibacter bethesdensis]|nr:Peptide deformylase [Granulibacter bethesdensis]
MQEATFFQGLPAGPSLPRGAWHRYIIFMSETRTAELLPILIAPHKTLKTRARPVTAGDASLIRDLVPRMFATMYKAPGIGLAAPQIDSLLRLAVVDVSPDDQKAPLVLINPDIIARSKEMATREEGCLSLPNQYADVTRPARIKLRYEDLDGSKREMEADDLLATCIQHEIDHLDGILFVDHLSTLKRNMLMRRLAKEQRQNSGG